MLLQCCNSFMAMQIKLIVVVVECSGSSSFHFSCSQEVFLECCFSEGFHAIFCIPGLKISAGEM